MAAPVLQFKRGPFANLPGLRAGEPAFTTDTFDLYVGIDSTTNNNKFFGSHRYWTKETSTTGSGVRFVERTDGGSNYIEIKAPNTALGSNVTYVLPGSQGSSSSVLTNDGSGNLSWASVSGSNNAVFTGITTFLDTTDNTLGDENTGSVQLDGGMGISKNLTIKQNLHVGGYSNFVGVVTFQGGTINLGDDTGDNINIGGEFTSGLYPNTTNTYDLGDNTRQWRNTSFAGVGTFSTGAVIDGVQIGINGANVIDTVSGNLTLNSAGGQTIIDDLVTIQNNLTVNGSVTIGGTAFAVVAQEILVANKDIVLGYTTSITPNDDTANHAGVAIASTVGSPLVNFSVSGINTLPDTYKQLMWFKSGTLGFSTDAFAFNYGVAIGTTTMANGTRLAVGTGITITDTAISATTVNATTGNFVNLSGSLTGTISTAARANTVNTVQRSTNATHYLTFVADDNASATAEVVYTDAGITYNPSTNNLTISGDLAINGVDVTTTATTFNLVNGTATSVNFGGAATALVMGAATGITTVRNKLTVGGNLEVDGNNIQASDGNTNITLTSNTLTTFAGDIRVNGNDIQASDGTTAISLSGSNVTVAGNLYVNGSTTQFNTSALTVEDRTIELGRIDGNTPSAATTWDLGVLFNYNSSGAKKSAVIWEHSEGRFKFASVLGSDTDGTDLDTPQLTVSTFSPIEIGSLWVNDCAGQSQVISCTGSTRYLENITIDAGSF
jgi:hypothetical protein